jgi:hypothetical protein
VLSSEFPWDELENLVGHQLKTLGEVHPFVIDRIELDHVVLIISTDEERWISRRAFRLAWARLKRDDEVTRDDPDRIEDRQGSYIAAILARLSGVQFAYNPVRVHAALPSTTKSSKHDLHVWEFPAWAAENCPYRDEEKRFLWETILSGCDSVLTWKELDEIPLGLIAEYWDTRLKRVPRRLRKEAREFLGEGT